MSKHERDESKGSSCSSHMKEQEELLPRIKDERDIALSRKEARGGSPADASVGGEEDAGVGLESVVRKNER